MALSQQQAASPSSKAAATTRPSASSNASLRPAAALAGSEAPAEASVVQQQAGMGGSASVIDSLQHEVERLQHLEQRRARLQLASAGNCLLHCRMLFLPMNSLQGVSGEMPWILSCFVIHLSYQCMDASVEQGQFHARPECRR